HRLAAVHVLGILAAGDDPETLLDGYPWLERADILACLAYAHRLGQHERVEPFIVGDAARGCSSTLVWGAGQPSS
ncbi:MAG: DUF433 domain-containing protein, partial [Chromatiaceae bacterium]